MIENQTAKVSQEQMTTAKLGKRNLWEFVLGFLLILAGMLLVGVLASYLSPDVLNFLFFLAVWPVLIGFAYASRKSPFFFWGMLAGILFPLLVVGPCVVSLMTTTTRH